MNAFTFTTKQKGYGRQGLYFRFDSKSYYLTDVFPNIPEHFNDYAHNDDCSYNEETEIYTNSNGREVTPIESWDEFLTERYKEDIGQVLFESLDFDDYPDFNFNDATYEQIAEWALNF